LSVGRETNDTLIELPEQKPLIADNAHDIDAIRDDSKSAASSPSPKQTLTAETEARRQIFLGLAVGPGGRGGGPPGRGAGAATRGGGGGGATAACGGGGGGITAACGGGGDGVTAACGGGVCTEGLGHDVSLRQRGLSGTVRMT
jgi:hypothetical protein